MLVITTGLMAFVIIDSYIVLNKSNFKTETYSNKEKEVSFFFKREHLYKNYGAINWKDNNKEIVINGCYYFEVIAINNLECKNFVSVNVKLDCNESSLNIFNIKFNNFSNKALNNVFALVMVLLISVLAVFIINYFLSLLSILSVKYLYKKHINPHYTFIKPPCC